MVVNLVERDRPDLTMLLRGTSRRSWVFSTLLHQRGSHLAVGLYSSIVAGRDERGQLSIRCRSRRRSGLRMPQFVLHKFRSMRKRTPFGRQGGSINFIGKRTR